MKLSRLRSLLAISFLLVGTLVVVRFVIPSRADPWLPLEAKGEFPAVSLQHPQKGAVLPRNMPAPVLLWKTNLPDVNCWVAGIKAGSRKWLFKDVHPLWRPEESDWREIKGSAQQGPVQITLAGLTTLTSAMPKCRVSTTFTIESEPLVTPLFFREVNLPFAEAVKDPTKIRWRFGPIDTGCPPPIVLQNLPVCGNCHSFSRNGELLAMDVDYANSKASYVITRTAPEMRLATSDIITWQDYKREENKQTFGLLSQISPDGRYVLSTVHDRSVFVPRPELAFSQLFFPLQGVIACYDRQTKEFEALPGADDPQFVQSNPTWSPDGKWIVFARNTAYRLQKLRDTGSVLLTSEECEEFLKQGKEFRFDLYRVPFNDGKGGKPEPLAGASRNRRSNYFPKYSPDGKWIVFCQAANYMLLQPDSELFIIPADGGEARRLECNLSRMNSWHSWSPDGKWLVFSSKADSDYTQLYLSRIDQMGHASPAVWLAHMVDSGRAANIPEFVSLPPGYISRIKEEFLDDYSFTGAGNEFFRVGEADKAIEKYSQALQLNPDNAMAHQRLGFLLFRAKGQLDEGMRHSQIAVGLEARNGFAHFDLGSELAVRGDLTNALVHLQQALELLPNGFDRNYSALQMNYAVAETCYRLARYPESVTALREVLRLDPGQARANYLMAMAQAWLGETSRTAPYIDAAIRAEPRCATLPDYWDLLSRNYVHDGRYSEALTAAEKGLQLATAAGRPDQAAKLQERADFCRSQQTTRSAQR